MTGTDRALLTSLTEIVGTEHVITAADQRRAYEVDWTGRFVGKTAAVVRPGSSAEVVAVVGLCRANGIAVVPQGGNTGLVGGGVPLSGELVIGLGRLDVIGRVDTVARQVTAGAGATVAAVHRAAAAAGLRYAVDFGARDSATIGGTVATNAGGVNVLRYGGTREQLLGVEAVLGTGHVVSRLGGLVKDNTGYDLASLLCGSEGTLGIITAARLRLVTRHEQRLTALIGFSSVGAAVDAVGVWRSSLDCLEAAELMLDSGMRLVCGAFGLHRPLERDWPAYVLIEVAAHEDPTALVAAAVDGVGAVGEVAVATDPVRRAQLWRYREEHTLAIGTIGVPHKFDVTVPIGALAGFVLDVPARVASVAPGAQTWQFGHVGDGNIHVNVTGADHEASDQGGGGGGGADLLDEQIYRYVSELGGSISAEHGIGTAKARWLHLNRSPSEIAAMRAVKRAFDPDRIMNPNALLPPPSD
jgi:FAD/FMN-containing dehydrogenase